MCRPHKAAVLAIRDSEEKKMATFSTNAKFQIIGFGAEPKSRTDQDGNPKLFESAGGKPTFATGGGVIGKNGLDKSVTVATLQPVRLEQGKRYQTAGQTWVTPWLSGRFIAYSVVCERVEPVDSQAKQ